MKYFEFGTDHFELTVILHGGGISYRGALPAAEYMARFYHVVLVSYDGFNPTEPDTTFRSVNHEAEMLANYINELYNGKIDILYGISYGCRVLMAVLPCTVRAGLCGSFRLRRVRRPAAELRLLAVLRPVFDHALSGKSLRHYRSGLVFAHKVPFFQH